MHNKVHQCIIFIPGVAFRAVTFVISATILMLRYGFQVTAVLYVQPILVIIYFVCNYPHLLLPLSPQCLKTFFVTSPNSDFISTTSTTTTFTSTPPSYSTPSNTKTSTFSIAYNVKTYCFIIVLLPVTHFYINF